MSATTDAYPTLHERTALPRWRRWAGAGILIALPTACFIVALIVGLYPIAVVDVLRILVSPIVPGALDGVDPTAVTLVTRLRLPRALAAALIGAALAVTGAAFQGVFRNPLVDANLLGVTSGAGFGAALALLFGQSNAVVSGAAFVSGLIAVGMAYAGARLYRGAPLLVLTLMGILIGSFFGSLTSLLKYVADPLDTLPAITFWLLGGLNGVTWGNLPLLALLTIGGGVALLALRWRINILSLGDDEARALGVDPTREKLLLILCATLMTAAAVSVGGVIGWIGLVIPHAGRLLVGADHVRLLPTTISLGATFLLTIDTVSRTLLPGEVPLGVLTGLIGVPLLIVLLRRGRSVW